MLTGLTPSMLKAFPLYKLYLDRQLQTEFHSKFILYLNILRFKERNYSKTSENNGSLWEMDGSRGT